MSNNREGTDVLPTAKRESWVFTINNPTEDCYRKLSGAIPKITYLVGQLERGGTGTLHFQGYCETSRINRKQIEKLLGGRAWVGARRGTQEQAINYVTKELSRVHNREHGWPENSIQWGTPRQKAKGDFKNALTDKSISATEIIELFPLEALKSLPNLLKMKEMQTRGFKRDKPSIRIYFGTTGTGKTLTASLKYPEAYNAVWPTGGRWWWPGYDGESEVILNEFRHQVAFNTLIQVLDRGNYVCEVKGGNVTLKANTFAITTNMEPKDWYPKVKDKSPLWRRIKEWGKIYKVTKEPLPEGCTGNTYKGVDIDFVCKKTRWEIPEDWLIPPKEDRMIDETPGTGPHGEPIPGWMNRMDDEGDFNGEYH